MTSKQIYEYLNTIYNFKDQDSWDNSCYYINNNNEVKNIIVCLDITNNIYNLAIDNNIDLVISHHPFMIKEPNSSNYHTRKLLGKFINSNINIITLHTPFDKSLFGMNVAIANKLKLSNIKFANDNYTIIAKTNQEISLKKFAKFVRNELNSNICKYLERYENNIVQNIAICAGSAFSNIYNLKRKDFDVFITCDLKHHNWIDSIELDIPIICLNHNIENIFVDVIVEKLTSIIPDVNIIKAKSSLKIKDI